MELRHLRYFIAVAEEMSFRKAADRLNISQPPLSFTIKQLEEEIGTDLFERVGRSIIITRAGQHFLDYAKKTIRDSDIAKDQTLLVGEGKKGILKIGFISSAITGVLQKIILSAKKDSPDVILDISQSVGGWLGRQVANKEYDLGIVRQPEYLQDGLICHPLTKEHWCAVLQNTHKLFKNKTISLEQLAKEDLIFYPRYNSPAGYDSVMNMFWQKDLNPRIIQEAPEQMTIAGLVSSGMGIGIVPACMQKISMAGLKHIPIEKTKNTTGFAIIHREEQDELIQNFMQSVLKIKNFS